MKDKSLFRTAPEWNTGGTARGFHGAVARLPRNTPEEAAGKKFVAQERRVSEAQETPTGTKIPLRVSAGRWPTR